MIFRGQNGDISLDRMVIFPSDLPRACLPENKQMVFQPSWKLAASIAVNKIITSLTNCQPSFTDKKRGLSGEFDAI